MLGVGSSWNFIKGWVGNLSRPPAWFSRTWLPQATHQKPMMDNLKTGTYMKIQQRGEKKPTNPLLRKFQCCSALGRIKSFNRRINIILMNVDGLRGETEGKLHSSISVFAYELLPRQPNFFWLMRKRNNQDSSWRRLAPQDLQKGYRQQIQLQFKELYIKDWPTLLLLPLFSLLFLSNSSK